MAVTSYHSFDDGTKLAEELSHQVAVLLGRSISDNGTARLAVSGGKTPLLFFDQLSKQSIDWSAVTVTLVDDRCVPPDHERSNQKLVRDTLLKNHAHSAQFDPAVAISEQPTKPAFCDVLVLGMGTDGHTASLFPNGDNLDEALNPDTQSSFVTMSAPGAPEPRVTMTLPAIVSAQNLFLHIEGKEKADVFEKALTCADFPIHHILRHSDAKLNVYWAP